MKRNFKFFATWVAVTGLLMGAAFGAGKATSKDATSDTGSGLTAQQIQQLLNGAGSSGGNASQQQSPGAGFGPPPGP